MINPVSEQTGYKNPFRKYSPIEIEECIAKALSDLTGHDVAVTFDELKIIHIPPGYIKLSVFAKQN